MQDSPAVLVYS